MPQLRPMTEAEYDVYLEATTEDYAQERAKNFGTTIEEERAAAREQIADLLDEGLATENHHIWVLDHEDDGNIGHIWMFINAERQRAFIYDVAIDATQRGKGYGKTILDLMEAKVKEMGVRSVGLNVFYSNTVARHLYEKQGYQITNYNMQKEL